MDFAEIPAALRAVIIIVGAVVAWFVLRFALKFTIRIFSLGCAALAVLLIIGGLVTLLT
ncbi:MAG: hypothetical protein ACE5JF_08305 [Anaerolineales bacterium]